MSTEATQPSARSSIPQPVLTLPNDISIRAWHSSDAAALSKCGNNIKIWRNLTDRFPHPYTIADANWWINHCNDPSNWLSIAHHPATHTKNKLGESDPSPEDADDISTLTPANFTICHANTPIGTVGLESDVKNPRTLALGYWLAEPYWGRGIATSVATAFTQWAFDTFPWLVRLDGDAYSWNEGSQRVLKKAGFVEEGRQRLKVWKEGKFGDLVLFGKVREGLASVIMETEEP